MEITVKARFLRSSPRKVRLVANLVKGLDVPQAEAQLTKTNKHSARSILELLKSAVAAAKSKDIFPEELRLKQIIVNQGPTFKRRRYLSRGRAATIRKRTSHLILTLIDKKKEVQKPIKEKLPNKNFKKVKLDQPEKKEDLKNPKKLSTAVKSIKKAISRKKEIKEKNGT